jgi:hypothetical protein
MYLDMTKLTLLRQGLQPPLNTIDWAPFPFWYVSMKTYLFPRYQLKGEVSQNECTAIEIISEVTEKRRIIGNAFQPVIVRTCLLQKPHTGANSKLAYSK